MSPTRDRMDRKMEEAIRVKRGEREMREQQRLPEVEIQQDGTEMEIAGYFGKRGKKKCKDETDTDEEATSDLRGNDKEE